MSAQTPADTSRPGISASRPVVSVMIGHHQVLHVDGNHVSVHVVPFSDHAHVVAALAKALAAFTAHQPELSPLLDALDAVEKLSAKADPDVAKDGLAEIGAAITDFRDRIESTSAARIPN